MRYLRGILMGCLALLALLATGLGVVALVRGTTGWLLVAHAVGAVAGLWAAHLAAYREGGPGWADWGLALGIPLAGWLVLWVPAVAAHWLPRQAVQEDFMEYVDANTRLGAARLPVVRRGFSPEPEYLEPFLDVLCSDAPDVDKRRAIEGLIELESPQAVQILKRVLGHESPEVRFYAASGLARLEERLTRRLRALEQTSAPDEPVAAAIQRLEWARAYFDHAYFGVVEEPRRSQYLERCLEHAGAAWQASGNPQARLLLGRACLELGRYAEAETLFSQHLGQTGGDAKVLLWRAEARFYQGRYADVREDCQQARRTRGLPEAMQEAAAMWT